MNHPSSMMASDPIRSHARPVCVYDREAAQHQITRSMWTTSIHRVRRSRTTAVGWVAVAQPRQDQEQRNKAARAPAPCHPAAPNGFACLLIAFAFAYGSRRYTCTCGPAWPGTAHAHKSTAHKGTAHKSTYLIMGRAVPARVPSHRPTARPTISYVCQAGPNSPKCLNVPDRPIYIQQ
jgi:hypothetical protein